MISFTEKLVEACIAASPSAFLPFTSSVDLRQPKLGGFIPDLILAGPTGPIILEIQLFALDRSHLYRLLEYRDLYEDAFGTRPEMMLMSEAVPDRFKPLLRTHGIKTLTFNRDQFLRTALENCAQELIPYVSNITENTEGSSLGEETTSRPSREIEPLRWSSTTSVTEVEDYFNRQIHALGINRYQLPLPYQGSTYQDLRSGHRDPILQAIQPMYRPSDWNWEKLLSEPGARGRVRVAKPRIGIGCYITQKGNFSAYFYDPDEPEASTWLFPPRDSTYGWSRPSNEILFVRDVTHLDPRPDHRRRYGDADWSGLDSILVGWLKAAYEDIIDAARLIYDVEVHSNIFLDLENLSETSGWRQKESIVGWRISSLEDELRRDAEARLLKMHQTYGIDVDTFVGVYAQNIGSKNQSSLAPAHIIRALQAAGASMDARDIRETLNQLRLVEPADYFKARPHEALNPRPSSARR